MTKMEMIEILEEADFRQADRIARMALYDAERIIKGMEYSKNDFERKMMRFNLLDDVTELAISYVKPLAKTRSELWEVVLLEKKYIRVFETLRDRNLFD